MQRTSIWVLFAAGVASVGCATQFMGTAPAQPAGSTYVAGSNDNRAAIWLCSANGTDCQLVEIDVED